MPVTSPVTTLPPTPIEAPVTTGLAWTESGAASSKVTPFALTPSACAPAEAMVMLPHVTSFFPVVASTEKLAPSVTTPTRHSSCGGAHSLKKAAAGTSRVRPSNSTPAGTQPGVTAVASSGG